MPTKQQIAAAYNAAIAQGLTPDAAAEAAGITDANFGDFQENADGRISPLSIGSATRSASTPNWTSEAADEDEEVEQQAATRAQGTTAPRSEVRYSETSTTTTTGGGSTTRVVQPTQYQDTPASTAAQQQADAAAAARDAKVAQLKAEGKSTAQILRDPEVKALAAQRDAAQNQAASLKAPVPGTGGVTTTTEPNTTTVETTYSKSSPNFQTQNAGDQDETVQYSEVSSVPAGVPTSEVTGVVPDVDPLDGDPFANQDFGDGSEDLSDTDIQEDPYAPDLDPYGVENEELDPATFAENQPVQYDAFGNEIPAGSTEEGVGAFGGEGPPIEGAAAAENPYGEDPVDAEQAAAQQADRAQLDAEQAAAKAAALDLARAQNTIANQRKNVNNADWRVRLRLAPQADYLYRAKASPGPGILEPLVATDGVLFPYTPTIQTGYKANYATVDITHSNYRGYFYQGSVVEPVTINCPFTAQDTTEADYLLAVIHFFKSVTKMFYGQDPQRGSPPPVVYLSGLGQFQFNEHPCVVTSFTYELPSDVDYIRARSPNVNNSNMLAQRQSSNPTTPGILGGFLGGAIDRLANSKLFNGQSLPKGGMTTMPAPQILGSSTLPTYVPTKMTISITLLPVISRQRQSQDFSLRQYANGDLLKGGMW